MSASRPNSAASGISAPVAAALNRIISPANDNAHINADLSPSANANTNAVGNNKVIYMPWTDKDEVNEVTNANTHNITDIIRRIGRRFASVGGIGKSLSKQNDQNKISSSRRYYFTGGMNKYDTFKSYNGGSFAGPNVYIEGGARRTTLKDEINKACLLLGNFARCNYDVTRFQLKFALENRLRMKISDRSIEKIFAVFDPFITGTLKLRKLVKVVILNSIEGFESELEWLYVRGQGDTYPPPLAASSALNYNYFDTCKSSNRNNNNNNDSGNDGKNESENYYDGFGTVQLFNSPKTTLQRPRTASAASASSRGASIPNDVISIGGNCSSGSGSSSNNNSSIRSNIDELSQQKNSSSSNNTNSKPSSSTVPRPKSAPLYRPGRATDKVAINSDNPVVVHSSQQTAVVAVPNSTTLTVTTLALPQTSSPASLSPHKPSIPRPLSANASPRLKITPTSPLATANSAVNTTTSDLKPGKNDLVSYFLSNAQISYKDWSAAATSVDDTPPSFSANAAAMTSRSNPQDYSSSHMPAFTYTGQKPSKLIDAHAPLLQAKYKFFRYKKRPTEQNDYGFFAKSYSHVQKTRDRLVSKAKGATTTIDLNVMMRDM